ncbi:hypothetical protein ACFQY5_25250 [Paeniroseomonas aquatica]|uniref:dioxygenase family protein n=1 Tax=Paeniroseomonas aquatica TaxID=373043 RepID=UPI003610A98E
MSFRPPAPGTQPPYDAPAYGSTHKRHPKQALLRIGQTLTETSAPRMTEALYPAAANLAKGPGWEAQGERIIVAGRVLDEDGRPLVGAMVEVWQANAAGRYNHERDTHDAPLDANFKGRAGSSPMPRAGTATPPSAPAPIPGATTPMPGGRCISTTACSARASPSG